MTKKVNEADCDDTIEFKFIQEKVKKQLSTFYLH